MFTKRVKNILHTTQHTQLGSCDTEKRQRNKNTNIRVAPSKSILDICNESVVGRGEDKEREIKIEWEGTEGDGRGEEKNY
jgi:hypothetical protein